MRRRTAHGRAAQRGQSVVYETPPTDELRPAPEGAAAPVERREDGTVTPEGAAELARMRWEAARMPDFAERELEAVPHEAFAPFDRARRDYLSQRRQELHERTGGVDSALGATVRGEAWMVAFGEFWAATAARTGSAEAMDRACRFFRMASTERAKAWDHAVLLAESRGDDHDARLRREQAEFQRELAERGKATP